MTIGNLLIVEAVGLRAVFELAGDRWSHRLEVKHQDQWTAVLQSEEGDPNEKWPPSPAIQDVDLQSDSDRGTVVYGVGMSGSSRWSLSCARSQDSEESGLIFDVACRTRGPFERIGSTYRPGESKPRSEIRCSLFGLGEVDFVTKPNQLLCLDLVRPTDTAEQLSPRTWQWSYRACIRSSFVRRTQ